MIYSSWDKKCDRLKLVILGHFLPFYPPKKTPKKEKRKKLLEISSFYMCAKNHYNDVRFLRHRVRQTKPFVILGHCLPLYPLMIPKIKTLKKWKKFMEKWQTEFVIWGHFLPFHPTDDPENQNFEKLKNAWRYHHFTNVHHKWQSYDAWFLRYEAQQIEFFIILDHNLLFYPSYNPKNKTFEEMPGDIMTDVIFIFHFGLFFDLQIL